MCGCGQQQPAAAPSGSAAALVTVPDLNGSWRVTSIEAAGQPVPADRVERIGLTYEFASGQLTIKRADRTDSPVGITNEAAATPRRLTIQKTPPIHAIYQIDGDVLKLCLMVDENPNAGFPTELASKPTPKTDLLTLKRAASTSIPATNGSPTSPATLAAATAPTAPMPPAIPGNQAAASQRRTAWRYQDAPLIFPGQPTTAGVFQKQADGTWLEERKGTTSQDWKETQKTDEYLEISRPDGGFLVRLYTDRCTYRYGNEADFKPMFPGKWE
jgi:uncharacterized protein (TIGR03067 family)